MRWLCWSPNGRPPHYPRITDQVCTSGWTSAPGRPRTFGTVGPCQGRASSWAEFLGVQAFCANYAILVRTWNRSDWSRMPAYMTLAIPKAKYTSSLSLLTLRSSSSANQSDATIMIGQGKPQQNSESKLRTSRADHAWLNNG